MAPSYNATLSFIRVEDTTCCPLRCVVTDGVHSPCDDGGPRDRQTVLIDDDGESSTVLGEGH